MTDNYNHQPNQLNITERAATISRRDVLKLGTLASCALIGYSLGDKFIDDGEQFPRPNIDPERISRLYEPEITFRPGAEEFGDAEEVDQDSSPESFIRSTPLFTLTHVVQPNDTVYDIGRRYTATEPGANASDQRVEQLSQEVVVAGGNIANANNINPGDTIYIPISRPVIVPMKSLKGLSDEWGFSESTLAELNPDTSQDYAVLPAQIIPKLLNGQEHYVVGAEINNAPATYYSIAQTEGVGLSTLIGANRPLPDQLERGHLLLISTDSVDLPPNTTPSTAVEATTATDSVDLPPNTTPSTSELNQERSWDEVIDEGGRSITHEDQALEWQISAETIDSITVSPERYQEFVEQIDRSSLSNVFAEANTLAGFGVLSKEAAEYFIIHHTASSYEEAGGVRAAAHLASSMAGSGVSVQWNITQDGHTTQYTEDPLQSCNHALSLNDRSTGVELSTSDSKAQGSLTALQIEQAVYLAHYVTTEIQGMSREQALAAVKGHREINDELEIGTPGKPDFDKSSMNAFRAKLTELFDALS